MLDYDFASVEKKWQERWYNSNLFKAKDDHVLPKFYPLIEFPYPSGEGLHVGHPRPYVALDIIARKRRMQGFNVLYTMGWDAFGLPAENFAIKTKEHPKTVTINNVKRFKEQINKLGLSFDWSREINTTDEEYYKWTQWIFLKLFEHGLAYKKEMSVNWCTDCNVVLANEEVVNGKCERCSGEVVKKVKNQWMLKITAYAQRLIDDLSEVDYSEKIKISQINWIGRSTGAQIKFETTAGDVLAIYTTRPDTIFGVTYMVISPEHIILKKWVSIAQNAHEIENYCAQASKKSEFERTQLVKEKTGVKIDGIYAINPANNKQIPIFMSDYVLTTYGTGAIMAVPAHDTRDWEFAKKYNVPVVEVVKCEGVHDMPYECDEGELINSGFLNRLNVFNAKEKIISWLQENRIGERKINFKLRDWVFSRQRYWGEPIPIINCEKCGNVPLDTRELPLKLPQIDFYEQTKTGESPLANIDEWVNVCCPKCGGNAKRETDTMPQWAGSSWYFLRYCDPKNSEELASENALKYWMPVDWYNGGMEHTTLHLLYSRFWHKFLFDIGIVNTKEPYLKRTSHGVILGENFEKMSKSRGNVVNPDDIVNVYGADTMRLYEMFIGDFEKAAPWNDNSIKGCKRFLDKVFNLQEILTDVGNDFSEELKINFNKTIKKITDDIEILKFNTAVAALMSLVNDIYNNKKINRFELKMYLILLNIFAPHISEEIWEIQKFSGMACTQNWPIYDENYCKESTIELAVQVNGKIKAKVNVNIDCSKEEIINLAKNEKAIKETIKNKQIKREIYVQEKLVNFVI